ncbi:MAG: MqnA/MqnD/SBP family protein [Romboutsia sp.]
MKKYISMILSIMLSVILLVGCSQKTEEIPEVPKDNLVEPVNVKVIAPDGLPSISIAKLAKEKIEVKEGYDIDYTVEKTPETLSTAVMKEEPDIAIVPSNMASIAYNKTFNYKIAGTVGMGSFYLVSTEDIKDMEDLVGKEVGNTGKALTPDITVQAILKEKGINPEEINFNYVNGASELVPLLATGKITTGFVPEPALSGLMSKNENIKIIKSLNDEWIDMFGSKEGYPQSTIIVKGDFAEKNKEFVNTFLTQLSDSIKWANENPQNAGEYAKEIGLTTEPAVIGKAMERSNLRFVGIEDMVEDYNDYYKKLFDFDVKSVGGKLPDEGIYFIEK